MDYIFSVISLPHHKIESDALMIAEFRELNELFDDTLNKGPICLIWSFSASNDQMEKIKSIYAHMAACRHGIQITGTPIPGSKQYA